MFYIGIVFIFLNTSIIAPFNLKNIVYLIIIDISACLPSSHTHFFYINEIVLSVNSTNKYPCLEQHIFKKFLRLDYDSLKVIKCLVI